jgi:protein tyrosine/serine phosphatase
VHVPLDDVDDRELWEHIWANELDGTPLYYRLFLDRKPERCAAAVEAIARARSGGVVFHCGGGRDRTGLVALLLLDLVGVTDDAIVADYELSNERLPPFWVARGMEDQRAEIASILERKQTSARELLVELLASFDAASYLRAAGLDERDLDAVRARLLG